MTSEYVKQSEGRERGGWFISPFRRPRPVKCGYCKAGYHDTWMQALRCMQRARGF